MSDLNIDGGLEPVAVIGMALRLPGAADPETFWRNIADGVESVRFFTIEELIAAGVPRELANHPKYVKARAALSGIEMFDAPFFGMTEREASETDPQHRLFLECAWEAMERAGYDSSKYSGRTGVFAGCGFNSYLLSNLAGSFNQRDQAGAYGLYIGNDKDFFAARVAYKLNLGGPCMTINTACSTSLVAIHTACQNLLNYQCDMAIAGGASVYSRQVEGYLHQDGMILSPDGHCRAFDERAAGMTPGSGVAVVVLKRLGDALADGDNIYAVVKGSSINNDGSAKAGFTAPSVDGQASVVMDALALADADPESITYVEAHGTGTPMGDPIEIAALTHAFNARLRNHCAIGSVKTNIGHTDTASGAAGLIKTALALHNKQLPPSINFEKPNPRINFADSPFYVNTKLKPWDTAGTVRRAGVSSLGIGGTNAHVILEEATRRRESGACRETQLISISAPSLSALHNIADNLARSFTEKPDTNLADAAFTLHQGRRDFDYRFSAICSNAVEAVEALKSLGHLSPAISNRPVAFLFTGQGSQKVNMGRGLYEKEPYFRKTMDECFGILAPHTSKSLKDILYPSHGHESDTAIFLDQTEFAQPALFAVSYSIARLFMKWGIHPAAMLGHSIGEYVCACIAGVFSLEDALRLVAARGKIMQKASKGVMTAIFMDETPARGYLTDGMCIAAVNAPGITVVSGPLGASELMETKLTADGAHYKRLNTSHAFHSSMMEDAASEFEIEARKVKFNAPSAAFISNVTGTWITYDDAASPSYWARHLRETVRFSAGVEEIARSLGGVVFLEAGPGNTLANLAAKHNGLSAFAALPGYSENDSKDVLRALGGLWAAGTQVDWKGFYEGQTRNRVVLPTYPFERKPYWIEGKAKPAPHAEENARENTSRFHVPSWKRSPSPSISISPESVLIFADSEGAASLLAGRIKERCKNTITVTAGNIYSEIGKGAFKLDPTSTHDYERLLDRIGGKPGKVVFAWSLSVNNAEDTIETANRYFHSIVNFLKAIEKYGSPRGMEIIALTRDAWKITGDEALRPECAVLAGPVRVGGFEYSGVNFRMVDFDSRTIHSTAWTQSAVNEIFTNSNDTVSAYRGRYRWVETVAPYEAAALNGNSLLRDGGVYLITGGLGAIGLAVAERIAATYKAGLILGGLRKLPPRSEWDSIEVNAASPRHNELNDFISTREKEIIAEWKTVTIDRLEGFERKMNSLCAAITFEYFGSCGVRFEKGATTSIDTIRNTLGVIPKFEKFFLSFIRILEEDSIIKRDGSSITFVVNGDEITGSASLFNAIEKGYPGFDGLLSLLKHCASNYAAALSGKVEAISVLYPDGKANLMEESLKRTVNHTLHGEYIQLLAETAVKLAKDAAVKGRTARILEFGGGSGAIAKIAAPLLKDLNVEYHFTDIGTSFVTAARENAKNNGYGFMRFSTLDITRDLEKQGLELGSFDAVFGLDVVHATPRIAETLRNVKKLLRPGGSLLLAESTSQWRWFDMAWGLAEGWWYFQDTNIRRHSPLMCADAWERVVEDCGFDSVTAYPQNIDARKMSGCAVISAFNEASWQEDGEINDVQSKIRAIKKLERLGAKVEVINGDIADFESLSAEIARAESALGPINGVIHSAGVEASATMRTVTAEYTDKEFGSKIAGTINLDRYFSGRKLDFFALFSSLSSITAGGGQAGYCAANAFMDAFANHRASNCDGYTISINWDMWRCMGQARPLQKRLDKLEGQNPHRGMTRDEGVDAFMRLMELGSETQVIVSAANSATHETESRAGAGVPASQASSSTTFGAPGDSIAAENVDGVAGALRDIWREALGARVIGLNDNFLEIGGDSLVAIKIASRIRDALGVDMPVKAIFESPTIAQLAATVENEMNMAGAGANADTDDIEEGVL